MSGPTEIDRTEAGRHIMMDNRQLAGAVVSGLGTYDGSDTMKIRAKMCLAEVLDDAEFCRQDPERHAALAPALFAIAERLLEGTQARVTLPSAEGHTNG